MQNLRSRVSGSAISELKELLELVSKPDKMKAALQELESEAKHAEDALKTLNERQRFIASAEEKISDVKATLDKQASDIDQKEKEVNQKMSGFNEREAVIHQQEKVLAEKIEAFNKQKQEFEADMVLQKSSAQTQIAFAAEVKERGEALVKEYNQKLAKINAAMN